MNRGRKPRRDELELWHRVARQVSPLNDDAPETRPPEADKPASHRTERKPDPLPMPQIGGGKVPPRNDLAPTLTERLENRTLRMDHKVHKRLRRGRLQPDARIDLHGMTLDSAHTALVNFVLAQHHQGKRLLLVITGKGRTSESEGPIPIRPGILRHQVPDWLHRPPLSRAVLQVTQAHASHGGTGAYYVYLRKSR